MPIYEFECRKCKAHLEVFQKINDKPPVRCRKCGGRLEKQVSASAIQFKGTGWYVTDYASKAAKESRSQDKAASAGETSGSSSESAGEKSGSTSPASGEKSEKKETSPVPAKKTDKASSTKPAKGE